MRLRLLILLTLLCFVPPCESRAQCTEDTPCPELARLNPCVLGGGVTAGEPAGGYCTGSTTCTATNPGNCELLCEDWMGSTDCDGGGALTDTDCRNVFAASTAAGYTLDFTSTVSGSRLCTDTKTSGVAQIVATGIDSTAYFEKNMGADKDDNWTQFYFNLVSGLSVNYDTAFIFKIFDSDGYEVAAIALYKDGDDGGKLKFILGYKDTGTNWTQDTCGTTELSAGTWYRVGLAINSSASTIALTLNGSAEASASDLTTGSLSRTWRFGVSDNPATDTTIQYDNIAISATGPQGACN